MADGRHEAELETRREVEITPKLADDRYRLLAKSALTIVRLQEQLTASHIDSTTGLPNRYTFDQRFNRLFWRAKAGQTNLSGNYLGLIVGDLDYLKDVNDTYGHLVGDNYLRTVSHAIQNILRPQDQIYRVGGDEFAAVLPDIVASESNLQNQLSRIKDRASNAVNEALAATSLPIDQGLGISLGIDVVRPMDFKPADAVNRVDQLMYIDKRQRRNL